MSPDDVAILAAKLDQTTSELSEIKVAMNVLITQFEAHRQAEALAQEIREKTCPNATALRKLQSDADGLAGIARRNTARIEDIEAWMNTEKVGDEIEGAQRTIIYTPVKWTLKNFEKIMMALVVAWLLFRFGL